MAHDVFVSYPSEDKSTADAVVAALESRGVRCWVAPRDVPPGMDWAAAIVDAISRSRMMVLVFSAATNSSQHILREVREAADADIPILPFRTSRLEPSPALKYYIGGTHWLDALTASLSRHLVELGERVAAHLAVEPLEVRPVVASPPPWRLVVQRRVSPRVWWVGGGVAGVVALAVLGVWLFGSGGEASTTTSPVAAGSSTTTTRATASTTVALSWSSQFVPSVYATVNEDLGPVVCRLGSDESDCDYLFEGDERIFSSVALADFNNDGDLDVVFAEAAAEGVNLGENVRCLWSGFWSCAGFDRFAGQRASGRVMPSLSVATGDLNGDGWMDVVFGNKTAPDETGLRAEVCYGTDFGTGFRCWAFPENEGTEAYEEGVRDIEIADMDGDGWLDVVLVGQSIPTEVCFGFAGDVLGSDRREGEGAPFECMRPHDGGGADVGPTDFVGVAVGDLDADGFEDLLLTHDSHVSQWCRGVGSRAFECEELHDTGPVMSALITDLTGDGFLDVVFGYAGGPVGYLGLCAGPLVPGAGCELNEVSGTSMDWWVDPIYADFDGDGVFDFIGQDMFCRGLGSEVFSCTGKDDSIRGTPNDFDWAATG